MSQKHNILLAFLGTAAAILVAAAAIPSWRSKIQDTFTRTNYKVLASAEGDLLNDGSRCKVVKYRGSEGLYVEILKENEGAEPTFIDRVLLPDRQDGQFNFRGHVTRLAIEDVDGNGTLELLAPTFDDQLVPHLNVLQYNQTTGKFELFQPPPSK